MNKAKIRPWNFLLGFALLAAGTTPAMAQSITYIPRPGVFDDEEEKKKDLVIDALINWQRNFVDISLEDITERRTRRHLDIRVKSDEDEELRVDWESKRSDAMELTVKDLDGEHAPVQVWVSWGYNGRVVQDYTICDDVRRLDLCTAMTEDGTMKFEHSMAYADPYDDGYFIRLSAQYSNDEVLELDYKPKLKYRYPVADKRAKNLMLHVRSGDSVRSAPFAGADVEIRGCFSRRWRGRTDYAGRLSFMPQSAEDPLESGQYDIPSGAYRIAVSRGERREVFDYIIRHEERCLVSSSGDTYQVGCERLNLFMGDPKGNTDDFGEICRLARLSRRDQ